MSHRRPRRILTASAVTSAAALVTLAFAAQAPQALAARGPAGQACLRSVPSGGPAGVRERVFQAAASTYGVPVSVLKGVSYMESRWDNHGASPSTSGGYGPMNLTDLSVPASDGKGDGSIIRSVGPPAFHTADRAARLTGLSVQQVKTDADANICGGAALLASYQRGLGRPTGVGGEVAGWYGAIRVFSQSASPIDSATFARRVLTVIKSGEARTTNDGQRVRLAPLPGLQIPALPVQSNLAPVDCPPDLGCEWVPAPYDWYGRPDPSAYGNHDLANRPDGPNIHYIVIHDTEATYNETLNLVQDPTYVSWNYTIRSSDGHVAQHTDANDVAWHAGNWYLNMHSIGIEHEGFAAQGATWFTESMYESSAALVRYLAAEYHIPLDRAHIIGHDQVPGILPKYVKSMHWDPGPYWDWMHYFYLLHAPLGRGVRATPTNVQAGSVVKVAPDFASNRQRVTGCTAPGVRCPSQGTNFVYLRTAPRPRAHLVRDIGLHRRGGFSTRDVADVGARVDAGQKFVVAGTAGHWIAIWYLGEKGWIYIPPSHSPLVRSSGQTVGVKSGSSSPVYGRAYPERAAYPSDIPFQRVGALQYAIKAGQRYVLADDSITTDYYYATTFNDSAPDDHTDVVGKDKYYEIWFGHRMAFVRAADVSVR